jgi:hypothetical protein
MDMKSIFFEIIGVVVAVGAVAISYLSLRHKFRSEERSAQKVQRDEYTAHLEWKLNMESEIESIKKETAEIKREREKNLTQIWGAVKGVEAQHNREMKEVNTHIGELIKEIRQKNEQDHCELKDLLLTMKDTIIELKTDFKNHKETHDLVKKPTRTR